MASRQTLRGLKLYLEIREGGSEFKRCTVSRFMNALVVLIWEGGLMSSFLGLCGEYPM